MAIGKEDILEVLNNPLLHQIKFSVDLIKINSDEYDMVADYIESGGVTIKQGTDKVAHYYPEIDTFETRAGDLTLDARTNILHECTHIASDINEYKITRLEDETAAYLAQFTFLMLLAPDTDKPPFGRPLNNMMRVGMDLVEKYNLGKPAEKEIPISPQDIQTMVDKIHLIPEYANIGLNEPLIANGIDLSDEQWARLLSRFVSRTGDHISANNVKGMLSTRSGSEKWVTSDNELITLVDRYRSGGDPQKKRVRQKLLYIFLNVPQASAEQLFDRLSSPKRGDLVSQRLNSTFSSMVKTGLLSALQSPR